MLEERVKSHPQLLKKVKTLFPLKIATIPLYLTISWVKYLGSAQLNDSSVLLTWTEMTRWYLVGG